MTDFGNNPWHVVRKSGLYVLDFIFPKRCLGCGRLGKYFCDRCRLSVKLIATNEPICPICQKLSIDGVTHPYCQTLYTIDGLTSFFRYDGIIKKAVKAIKYRYISDLAREFINLIPFSSFNNLTIQSAFARASTAGQFNNFVLVPIPLHPSRYRERGFNQAEVLGKLIARRLNIPMRTDIIKRVKKTTPQVQMKDRKKRLENMRGVFSSNNLTMKQCNNVILFDDVFTTGATLRSAANVLKRVGVRKVWGVTMAR